MLDDDDNNMYGENKEGRKERLAFLAVAWADY